MRNFRATGVDLSQLPMMPADALIDGPMKGTMMIDTDEFEVIDDSDGEQGKEGIACALPMPPIQVKEEEPMRVPADASTQQQQQQQQTDLQAFGFTREAVPATQRRNAAVIDKIAAEIAAVENTETKFQSLPETYKERAVMLPSDSENDEDDIMDADFDPFAMKATMAGKLSSKKRKVIDDLNATTEAEENEIIENDVDGEKENNFEHRNAQQQRQQQQTLKEVEFNIDVVRVKRLKRAKREKRLALERGKKPPRMPSC